MLSSVTKTNHLTGNAKKAGKADQENAKNFNDYFIGQNGRSL